MTTRKKETENSAVVPAEVEVLPPTGEDEALLANANADQQEALLTLGIVRPTPKLGRALLSLYYPVSVLSKGFVHDKETYKVVSFDGARLILEGPSGEIPIEISEHPKYGMIAESSSTNEPNRLTKRALESLSRESIDTLAAVLSDEEFVRIVGGLLRVMTRKKLSDCQNAAKAILTEKHRFLGHSISGLLPKKAKKTDKKNK